MNNEKAGVQSNPGLLLVQLMVAAVVTAVMASAIVVAAVMAFAMVFVAAFALIGTADESEAEPEP